MLGLCHWDAVVASTNRLIVGFLPRRRSLTPLPQQDSGKTNKQIPISGEPATTKTQLTQMPPALPWSCTHRSCGMATTHCMATTCRIGNNVSHWQQHIALATTHCMATSDKQRVDGDVSHDDNALHGDNASHGNNTLHGDHAMQQHIAWQCHHCKQMCKSPLMQCNATTKMMPALISFLSFWIFVTWPFFPTFLFIQCSRAPLGAPEYILFFPGCWCHLSPHWKSWLIVFTQRFPWLQQSHQKSTRSCKKGPYLLKTRWVCPGFV